MRCTRCGGNVGLAEETRGEVGDQRLSLCRECAGAFRRWLGVACKPSPAPEAPADGSARQGANGDDWKRAGVRLREVVEEALFRAGVTGGSAEIQWAPDPAFGGLLMPSLVPMDTKPWSPPRPWTLWACESCGEWKTSHGPAPQGHSMTCPRRSCSLPRHSDHEGHSETLDAGCEWGNAWTARKAEREQQAGAWSAWVCNACGGWNVTESDRQPRCKYRTCGGRPMDLSARCTTREAAGTEGWEWRKAWEARTPNWQASIPAGTRLVIGDNSGQWQEPPASHGEAFALLTGYTTRVGDTFVTERPGYRLFASPTPPRKHCACDWRTGQNASGDWGWVRFNIAADCQMHTGATRITPDGIDRMTGERAIEGVRVNIAPSLTWAELIDRTIAADAGPVAIRTAGYPATDMSPEQVDATLAAAMALPPGRASRADIQRAVDAVMAGSKPAIPADHCPVHRVAGVFRQMALVCPTCGRLIGGL